MTVKLNKIYLGNDVFSLVIMYCSLSKKNWFNLRLVSKFFYEKSKYYQDCCVDFNDLLSMMCYFNWIHSVEYILKNHQIVLSKDTNNFNPMNVPFWKQEHSWSSTYFKKNNSSPLLICLSEGRYNILKLFLKYKKLSANEKYIVITYCYLNNSTMLFYFKPISLFDNFKLPIEIFDPSQCHTYIPSKIHNLYITNDIDFKHTDFIQNYTKLNIFTIILLSWSNSSLLLLFKNFLVYKQDLKFFLNFTIEFMYDSSDRELISIILREIDNTTIGINRKPLLDEKEFDKNIYSLLEFHIQKNDYESISILFKHFDISTKTTDDLLKRNGAQDLSKIIIEHNINL